MKEKAYQNHLFGEIENKVEIIDCLILAFSV